MRIRRCSALTVVWVAVALGACTSSDGDVAGDRTRTAVAPELADRLDVALADFVEDSDVPGVSVAVELADGRRWTGAAGVADEASREQVTPSTPFRLASITKTYTSAIAMLLVGEGDLDLDEPVTLDGVPRGATMRQLLSHTSGLPNDYPSPPGGRWIEEGLASIRAEPVCEPGACVEYTDLGYIAAGLVLEQATGDSLDRLAQDRLLSPLALHRTWFVTGAAPRGTAVSHRGDGPPEGQAWEREFGPRVWAAGAMVATASDVLDWSIALFDGDVVPADQLDEMLDMSATSDLPCGVCSGPYGLGIEGRRPHGRTTVGHAGSTGSIVAHLDEENVTIAVLTNRFGRGESALVALLDALGIEDRADIAD